MNKSFNIEGVLTACITISNSSYEQVYMFEFVLKIKLNLCLYTYY